MALDYLWNVFVSVSRKLMLAYKEPLESFKETTSV